LRYFRQRPHIDDAWAIYNFLLDVCTANEQKVEIIILLLIEYFQPELLPNSEQKVDEMHFCPANANGM
jgi:hypothetical protein